MQISYSREKHGFFHRSSNTRVPGWTGGTRGPLTGTQRRWRRRFSALPRSARTVIVDLGLPRLNGRGLAELKLKLRPGFPTPVTTGSIDNKDHDMFSALGIETVLRKPFTMKEILRTVGDILTPSETGKAGQDIGNNEEAAAFIGWSWEDNDD